jgi:RND family efflux transporter MFP subunit
VVGGAAVLALIFTTEPVALRETQTRQTAMLVEVTQAERGDFRPTIQALGTVIAAREITLTPRVSGEVTELAEAFDPGGFVSRGEVMVRIDDADYRNLLAQRESELQQAIATLEMERGASAKAEQDYRQLNKEVPEDRKALILREPQLRSAEAVVQSARAAVEQARLDLQRTIISAPFDAHVLSREVSVGSQVSASDPLARLAGVDRYWIETTIPPEKLRWLTFPDNGAQDGSRVSIRQRTAWTADQFRSGPLYRLIGDLEGITRLARALGAVGVPLARKTGDRDGQARLRGS